MMDGMMDRDNSVAQAAPAAWIVYDGDCPFCSRYVRLVRLRDAIGPVALVNARDGGELVDEIRAAGGSARFFAADFASFAQTREFGETILAEYDRIDVLVNNAGIGSAPDERWVSEDGHEFRFQVNYLSHFLLTDMFLPLLREGAPSRIVNVSSLAQQPIDFDDVMIEQNFSGGRAYAQSKLAQILHTFDLHEELAGQGIMVNALHPARKTDMGESSAVHAIEVELELA